MNLRPFGIRSPLNLPDARHNTSLAPSAAEQTVDAGPLSPSPQQHGLAVTHDESPPSTSRVDPSVLQLELDSLQALVDMARSQCDELTLAVELDASPSTDTQAALQSAQWIYDQFRHQCDHLWRELRNAHTQTLTPTTVHQPQPIANHSNSECPDQAPVLAHIKQLLNDKRLKNPTASALAQCNTYQQALCLIMQATATAKKIGPWDKVRHRLWCPILRKLYVYTPRNSQLLACMLLINCYQSVKEPSAPEFFKLLATYLPTDGWPDELGPYKKVCLQSASMYLPRVRQGMTRNGQPTKHLCKPSAEVIECLDTIKGRLDVYLRQATEHPQIDMLSLINTPWPASQ